MHLKEACTELGISYNTIRKYIKLGLIKYTKMGKFYQISKEEIDRVKREGIELPK